MKIGKISLFVVFSIISFTACHPQTSDFIIYEEIQNAISALKILTGSNITYPDADTDGNGRVDLNDVILALRKAIGFEHGEEMYNHLTTSNFIRDIVNHPAFEGFGELLLPRDNNSDYYHMQLGNVASLMPYHSHVEPKIVTDAINHMIDEVSDDKTIFYDFYTDEQKQQDPNKRNTGLFFFRGKPDAPFAIVCPGGGFSYVGSLHEGFPLALEISKKGYNAFVIRYRIGSEQWAAEDLAAAIAYIFRNAELLEISKKDYSLWGGSAGARMVGDIALNGVSAYGGGNLPKPAVAIIAYTGQSTYSGDFSPAFITVAANDGIVNVYTVENRVENLRNAGVEVEYRRYETAGHGFGLGTGTDAEGWADRAVQFWQRHITDILQNEVPQQIYLWEEGNAPATTVLSRLR